MQDVPAAYGFDAFRKDMEQHVAEHLRQRSAYDRIRQQQKTVHDDADRWRRAHGLGQKETASEFAERLSAEMAALDADKASALLERELTKTSEEIDKSITQFSEVAVGTAKTGIKALAVSPDAIGEGVGLFDKLRKLVVNPHTAKEERLGAINAKFRGELKESGVRLLSLAQMALNSTAYKAGHRLTSLDMPSGRSDVVDEFKAEHAYGLPALSDVTSSIPTVADLMRSGVNKAKSFETRFGVEVAVALYDGGIYQNVITSAQASFTRSMAEGLNLTSPKSIENSFSRLCDLLEASSLHMQAADEIQTKFAQRRNNTTSILPASILLSTIKSACRGEAFAPSVPLGPSERLVSISETIEELETAKMLVRAEELKSPQLKDFCIKVSSDIDKTTEYLKEMSKYGLTDLKISSGPADTDFFSRLREETGWQYEPLRELLEEQASQDIAKKQERFRDQAKQQIGAEMLANQMANRIRSMAPTVDNELPNTPAHSNDALPAAPRPK